jgi:UbiD family decarboxylase
LQALDEQGQLLKIEEEVNAEPDLAAAANATGRIGEGAPALWFDNIRGFTDARVTMNTIGSWQNHAISMGLPANTPVFSRSTSPSSAAWQSGADGRSLGDHWLQQSRSAQPLPES